MKKRKVETEGEFVKKTQQIIEFKNLRKKG